MSRENVFENFEKMGVAVAQNTRAQMAVASRIEAGQAKLQMELAKANEIADKTARMLDEQRIRQRIADEEKQEQIAIKNAVFAFKQDKDFVLKGSNGLQRYVGLKKLSEVGKIDLVRYTNKLTELTDKEYSNNLLNDVYDSTNEAFHSLTDAEKDDLRKLGQLWAIQKEVTDLSDTIEDAQRNLLSRQEELVQYQQEYKQNKKLPSRIGAVVKLLLVIAFTITFGGLPLPLLLVGGIRRWVGNLYKAIINGTKMVDESAQKVSVAQQEVSRLENVLKANAASLEEAKTKLVASKNELASIFNKYDLSAS